MEKRTIEVPEIGAKIHIIEDEDECMPRSIVKISALMPENHGGMASEVGNYFNNGEVEDIIVEWFAQHIRKRLGSPRKFKVAPDGISAYMSEDYVMWRKEYPISERCPSEECTPSIPASQGS